MRVAGRMLRIEKCGAGVIYYQPKGPKANLWFGACLGGLHKLHGLIKRSIADPTHALRATSAIQMLDYFFSVLASDSRLCPLTSSFGRDPWLHTEAVHLAHSRTVSQIAGRKAAVAENKCEHPTSATPALTSRTHCETTRMANDGSERNAFDGGGEPWEPHGSCASPP